MIKTTYINILKLNELFKHFTNKELLNILNEHNHSIMHYKKNSVINFQNERCTTLNFILDGNVIVQKIDENGNALTIKIFSEGETFGENLLFSSNNTYPMTLIAKSNCSILRIQKDLIFELCHSNKEFLYNFLQSISNKALILTKKIRSITMKTIRQCIIDFLTFEYHHQKTEKIRLNMTKKELAEKLGFQRTSLSRELNKMKKDGFVDFDKDYITIKDLSVLNQQL